MVLAANLQVDTQSHELPGAVLEVELRDVLDQLVAEFSEPLGDLPAGTQIGRSFSHGDCCLDPQTHGLWSASARLTHVPAAGGSAVAAATDHHALETGPIEGRLTGSLATHPGVVLPDPLNLSWQVSNGLARELTGATLRVVVEIPGNPVQVLRDERVETLGQGSVLSLVSNFATLGLTPGTVTVRLEADVPLSTVPVRVLTHPLDQTTVVLREKDKKPPKLEAWATLDLAEDVDQSGNISPGDVLRYHFVLRNVSDPDAEPADQIEIDMPVPAYTELVPGSIDMSHGVERRGLATQPVVGFLVPELLRGDEIYVSFDLRLDSLIPQHVTRLQVQVRVLEGDLGELLSDDPNTPEPGDPTVIDLVRGMVEIPTLGSVGLVLLILLLLLISLRRLREAV